MLHGIVCKSDRLLGNFCWPSIATLPKGRLAAVASGYRLGHVCPFGKVIICFSDDDGLTWTQPRIILDTPLDDRDAGICVNGDIVVVTSFNNSRAFQKRFARDRKASENRLVDAYLEAVTDEEEREFLGSSYIVSADGGKTFGQIQKSCVMNPHGPAVLSDGSFFYFGKRFEMENEGGGFDINEIAYVRSENGVQFGAPTIVNIPPSALNDGVLFCEAHALQLKSGKLLVQMRAQKQGMFTIYQTESTDNGVSFGEWKCLGFHGSPPHLMQHSSGAVVMTYGYRQTPFGQRARISQDDGDSWGQEIVLRDDGMSWDLGYPSTAEAKDGSLITVYYQKAENDRNKSIMFTKWSLTEL